MRSVLVVLIVTLAASVALADGPTVAYKYVASDGVISFTDDEKRVPKAYKASAEKVTLGELGDYERFTSSAPVAPTTESPRLVALRAANAAAPSRAAEKCDGPVTVKQERRERTPADTSWTGSNTYNSMFYVVRDACGNEKSVTLVNPLPLVTVTVD